MSEKEFTWKHEVISIPHQLPIRCWHCDSFEEHAINFMGWDCRIYNSIEEAVEDFGSAGDIPSELAELLKAGPAVEVMIDGQESFYRSVAGFDAEAEAREFCASDEHAMIVVDSVSEAKWELEHYSGHQQSAVRTALISIISRYTDDEVSE